MHLTAVDTLDGEAVEDELVPVELCVLTEQTELCDAAAVYHVVNHGVETSLCAGHFETDVEAFHDAEILHEVIKAFLGGVDRILYAELLCEVDTVVVQVGDNNVACAAELCNASCHDADRACTGNENVFADEVKCESGVNCVSEGVEEGVHFFRNVVRAGTNVGFRDYEVFCERTVTVYADADGFLAEVTVACEAVTALAANDVTFAGYDLTNGVTGRVLAGFHDFTNIFVTDYARNLNGVFGPLVPVVDVKVGAADGGLVDLDLDVVVAAYRFRNFVHPQAGLRIFLNKCKHDGYSSFYVYYCGILYDILP